MTKPTPHGQVPEALQPEAFLKGVVALCGQRGYSPTNIEAWDKNEKWIADLWRQTEAMLAASPTPPAEQQAAPSAVLKAIHEANMQLVRTGDDAFMLVPYKLATAEQAAPKAAPGEPSDAEIDAFLDSPGGIEWVIADKRERYRLLVRAVLAKWAAPRQEAQEPVAWLSPWRADQVTTDYDAYGERGIPLYTAPQPAPAPLSDEREAFESTWEKLYGKKPVLWDTAFKEAKMDVPAHSAGKYFYRDAQAAWKAWQARAALAAQGGK